jgi:hypothetical protein
MLSLWGSKALGDPAVVAGLEAGGIRVPRGPDGKPIIPSKLQLQELMEETQANLLRDKKTAEMLAWGALGGYKAAKEEAETRRAEAQERKADIEALKTKLLIPYEIRYKEALAGKTEGEAKLVPAKGEELQAKIRALNAQAQRLTQGEIQATNLITKDEQGRPCVVFINKRTGETYLGPADALPETLLGKESKGPGTTYHITGWLHKEMSNKESPLRKKVKLEGMDQKDAEEIAQFIVASGGAPSDTVRVVPLEPRRGFLGTSQKYRVEIIPKDGFPPIRVGGLFQRAAQPVGPAQPAKSGEGTWVIKGPPASPAGTEGKVPTTPLRFGAVPKEKLDEWAQKLRELTSSGIGVDPWAYSNSAMVQGLHGLEDDLRAELGEASKEESSQELEVPDWFEGYFFRSGKAEEEEEEEPETE